MVDPDELATLPLFAGLTPSDLRRVAALVEEASTRAGDILIAEGAQDAHFIVIAEGEAVVRRGEPDDSVEIAHLGTGSFAGEMSLLHHERANATVEAASPLTAYEFDADAFAQLLRIPALAARIAAVDDHRAATNWARTLGVVAVALADGSTVGFRPLRLDDAERLTELGASLSPETARLRFLSVPRLTRTFVERFVDLDLRDHFAWAAVELPEESGGRDERIVAVGRYVRLGESAETAEYALVVADDYQRRGIGTFLLNALGAVAQRNGLTHFEAYLSVENTAMCHMLATLGAEISLYEPGVYHARFAIDALALADVPDRVADAVRPDPVD